MSVPFVHSRPFLSFRNYHFQKEAKLKIFFVPLSLALKQRLGVTRKWPNAVPGKFREDTEMPKVVDSSD